jgi:DNA-binding response OmpR family regulator
VSSAVVGQPPPTGEPQPAGEAWAGELGGSVGGPLKILVADDEPAMVGVIGAILGGAGHRIIAAYDGREAIRRFEEEHPDLVLIDLAMPGVDGADVVRRIRAAGDTPIIVVSGESDLGVTVELLDAGADDYVRKPFRAAELLARARTVVRRRRRAPARDGWLVDRSRHEVTWRGRPIPLTGTEYRLVWRLVDRLGEVVDRRDLLAFAWPGVERPDPLWLKPHMARLRRKLIAAGAPVPVPIRAIGYRLDDAVGDETVATAEPEPTPGRSQP